VHSVKDVKAHWISALLIIQTPIIWVFRTAKPFQRKSKAK